MAKTLFIGGTHDGERRELATYPSVLLLPKAQVFSGRQYNLGEGPRLCDAMNAVEHYNRWVIPGQRNQHVVYAIESLADEDAFIAALIGGYGNEIT